MGAYGVMRYQWDYNPAPDESASRRLQQETKRREARRLKIRDTYTPDSLRTELVLGPSISCAATRIGRMHLDGKTAEDRDRI